MIQEQLNRLLTEHLKFPDSNNLQQRGIADKIEDACNILITNNFQNVSAAKSNRSIEDINIGNTYIDHKSSDAAREFKMPNLISIDRLRKLDRELYYNFIIYDSIKKEIIKTFALNVYELNWEHLKIQNLGKGQLQICDMKKFLESPITTLTKDEWITELCNNAIKFYKKVQGDALKREKDWIKYNESRT